MLLKDNISMKSSIHHWTEKLRWLIFFYCNLYVLFVFWGNTYCDALRISLFIVNKALNLYYFENAHSCFRKHLIFGIILIGPSSSDFRSVVLYNMLYSPVWISECIFYLSYYLDSFDWFIKCSLNFQFSDTPWWRSRMVAEVCLLFINFPICARIETFLYQKKTIISDLLDLKYDKRNSHTYMYIFQYALFRCNKLN